MVPNRGARGGGGDDLAQLFIRHRSRARDRYPVAMRATRTPHVRRRQEKSRPRPLELLRSENFVSWRVATHEGLPMNTDRRQIAAKKSQRRRTVLPLSLSPSPALSHFQGHRRHRSGAEAEEAASRRRAGTRQGRDTGIRMATRTLSVRGRGGGGGG